MSRRISRRSAASARLREHLSVIRACEKFGESLKSYAKRQGISVHALYQAKKAARQQGLLPPYRSTRSVASQGKNAQSRRFVEARATTSMAPPLRPTWRVRFASGDALESDSPLSTEAANLPTLWARRSW